jgi:hypothetical protein
MAKWFLEKHNDKNKQLADFVGMLRGLLNAARFLHLNNIMHRDIKVQAQLVRSVVVVAVAEVVVVNIVAVVVDYCYHCYFSCYCTNLYALSRTTSFCSKCHRLQTPHLIMPNLLMLVLRKTPFMVGL